LLPDRVLLFGGEKTRDCEGKAKSVRKRGGNTRKKADYLADEGRKGEGGGGWGGGGRKGGEKGACLGRGGLPVETDVLYEKRNIISGGEDLQPRKVF